MALVEAARHAVLQGKRDARARKAVAYQQKKGHRKLATTTAIQF